MRTEDAYSIIDIVNEEYGVILTKGGNICISFALREPECYSLSVEDIDQRNNMWKEAFKFLPDGTYVHKQDFFLSRTITERHHPAHSSTGQMHAILTGGCICSTAVCCILSLPG